MSKLKKTLMGLEDQIHICGKIWEWLVTRGEKLTKFKNSWFFAKFIKVEHIMFMAWSKTLNML